MYKVCHTEQSSARQRMIENALLQLMLKQRYEDISVSDLCAGAGIPRKAFYRYFSSKDGALYALVDHTLDALFERPSSVGMKNSTIAAELERTFDYWRKNRPLLDALAHSSLSGILVERANRFALREGHMPRQFKRFSPQVRELALSFFISGVVSMVLRWHQQGFLLTPKELTTLSLTLLSSPLVDHS